MKLAELSIRRPVFAVMLIASLVVFGMLSYPRMGVDLFPDIEFPVVTVTVIYPGADPETMETKVADPIEESINTLSGIKVLRSVNLENVTQIAVQFELEVSVDQAVQDIRDRVNNLRGVLPPNIDPPLVQKFDVGAAPIMAVALAGNLSPRALTELADDVVKERLQRVRGVGGIDLIGGQERQIKVLVDPARMSGMGLAVEDLASAIRAQNLDMPAGSFERGTQELSVKTKGELKTLRDIENVLIPNPGGILVRVRDVAEVVDTTAEARSASFLDGTPAVSLIVRKQSGSNTVDVARRIRDEIELLKPRLTQAGASITIPSDHSVFIAQSIHEVQFDLIFGGILAIIIILFFLGNLRATIISAVALPTSVIATFAFMSLMGFTLNTMTMLALSLSIGILIDDAIVVIENIHRHHELGEKPETAAARGTAEIFLAVLATTSSILAVFVPVAFMKGLIGRFFFQFGLTVSFAVAVSMLVSFTLTPMLSSRFLGSSHAKEPNFVFRAIDGALKRVDNAYGSVLRASLRHRAVTVVAALVALAGSVALVSRVPNEFMPPEDRGEFIVFAELPTGSSLKATTAVSEAIAADIRKHAPNVVHAFTTAGGGAQGKLNEGQVQVVMTPSKQRSFSQEDLMAWVRSRYGKLEGVQLSVTPVGMIGGGGSGFRQQPIQYNLRGRNMDELVSAAEKLKAELAKTKGFVDLDITYRGGRPELEVQIDRERAADLGVPVASVAMTIRSLMADDAVSELKVGTETSDIVLQLPEDQRQRIEAMANLQVRAVSGQLVSLANVVTVNSGEGPSQIDRQARQRQVTVLAGLEDMPLGEAKKAVEAAAASVVPTSLDTDFAGMADIMTESFGFMLLALVLAVLMVYMILAAQFDSFVQPITIMLSLPLSVIGAFGALYLTGMTLNILSMIGVIMLMGLVTKNAILLVDFAIQRRKQGLDMREALVQAGMIRLRPILMTTGAMIFGMLPVALALSEGGEMRAPMAICVIGGLITSTLLTLVVVPVVYTFMDALANSGIVRFMRRRLMVSEPPPAPVPASDTYQPLGES